MTSKDYDMLITSGISLEAFHTIHTQREKKMIESGGRVKEPVVVCNMCENCEWMGMTKQGVI